VDWINLAQDRDKWRDVVNTVINLKVANMFKMCWLAKELLASPEGLCSMELIT
jgi:hypothetical protein